MPRAYAALPSLRVRVERAIQRAIDYLDAMDAETEDLEDGYDREEDHDDAGFTEGRD